MTKIWSNWVRSGLGYDRKDTGDKYKGIIHLVLNTGNTVEDRQQNKVWETLFFRHFDPAGKWLKRGKKEQHAKTKTFWQTLALFF